MTRQWIAQRLVMGSASYISHLTAKEKDCCEDYPLLICNPHVSPICSARFALLNSHCLGRSASETSAIAPASPTIQLHS